MQHRAELTRTCRPAEGGTKRALTRLVSNTGTSTLKLTRKRTLLLGGLTLMGALGAAGVLAIHHVPQAGPLVANSLRKVIGVGAVARLEELAASAEDSVMRLRWQGERPRSLSDMSPTIVGADTHHASAPVLPVAPLAAISTAGVSVISEPPALVPSVAPIVSHVAPASIAPPYP